MSKTVVAIIPYANGFLGFVAIEHAEEGRSRIIYADTFEACGLELLPEIVAGKDKRRVFDDEHWLALKSQMDTLLLAYRPERILCDVPSVRSTLAVKVAEAVLEHLDDYTETNSIPDAERIPSAWMSVYGGPIARDEMRQAIAANFDHDESIELKYDGTLRAAAMASYCLFGSDNIEKMPRVHRPRNSEPKPERGDCPTFEAAPIEEVFDVPAETIANVATSPPVTGKIVAGLDSGSRSLAIAIGQGDARPVALRYLRTFDVGESVPLPRPKIIKYAGGIEHVVTTKRVLSAEFVTKLADDVVEILRQQGVERLIVEHVDYVHIAADQIKAASSIATALLRTVWIAAEIAVRARFAGIDVVRVRHLSWVAKLCGKIHVEEGVRLLPEAVREAVHGWPLGANEHEYDAAGIMAYGALMEEEIAAVTEKRERKAATAPVMKFPRKSKAQIKQEQRDAVGCKCTTKHQNTCPLYKPQRAVPAWAAKILESAK